MLRYLPSFISMFIVAVFTLSFNATGIFADDILPFDETGNESTGSITLCKIIVDQNGNMTDGGAHSGDFNFPEVEAPLPPYVPHAAGTIPATHFASPLVLNADLIGNDGVNDAQCISYLNLHLGAYFYAQENINGSDWGEPLYNDQYTASVTSLADFFPYSRRFSLDGHEDVEHWNKNSDGQIVLSANRPDRTIIVLNKITSPAPSPACRDNTDNDGDGKTDAADPACHSDGDPDNTDTYTPTADSENSAPIITLLGANPMNLTTGDTFTDPGATAFDEEDGNIATSSIAVTGAVSTTTAGTYTVRYNVTDSEGLAAAEKTRTVVVSNSNGGGGGGGGSTPACRDNTDNDGDGKTDAADPACHSDGDPDNTDTYTPTADSENSAPIITLLGANPMNLTTGDTFTDPGATAFDEEDGNIATSSIAVTGAVSTTTAGTYTVRYNVKDSKGLSAQEKTRTIIVAEKPAVVVSPPGGSGGGGGGCSGACGGGGVVMLVPSLQIFNETIEKGPVPGIVLVRWQTNIPSDSRAVYGTASVASPVVSENYGYQLSTSGITELTTDHLIAISGLKPETRYYFRPVSKKGDLFAIGKELVFSPSATVPTADVTSKTCYYLREFIKFGANNNPEEVKKLQVFLNSFEKTNLTVTGIYDVSTRDAVNAFQSKHKVDILDPWGHDAPTGYVYLTTRKKVNEIYCRAAFPLNQREREEVAAFKKFLEELKAHGISPSDIDMMTDTVGEKEDEGNEDALAELVDDTSIFPTGRSAFRNALGAAYTAVSRAVASYWLVIIFAALLAIAGMLLKEFYEDEEYVGNATDDTAENTNTRE